ncbi:MAG TPA: hypothetical protein VGN37_21530 [Actinocatenispora sp.]
MFAGQTRARGTLLMVAFAALAAVFSALPATGALAAPDEGGSKSVYEKLDIAARNYNNAKNKLDATRKKQKQLTKQIADGQKRIDVLTEDVGRIAAAKYRGGNTSLMTLTLSGESGDNILAMADTLTYLGQKDTDRLRTLKSARQKQDSQKRDLAATAASQKKQAATLKKRRDEAQKAVDQVSGGASGGYSGTASADPAPRNSDGSWPSESCSVDDPTTDGCITPRMLHAYQQVRKAGYTRFTACYRSAEDGGEHPRGRACDFSVSEGGFGGEATGGERTYGNNLAGWLTANSERLAVLYVIWFRQIWMPGVGWSSYSGSGSPSAEHTNHVHLSVQ